MKILLACSAGMSTSLLEKAINEYMKKQNLQGQAIALSSDQAREKVDQFDVILLGPQIRFMLAQFKTMTKKPVAVIEPLDYALANGKAIVEQAKKMLNKKG